MLNRSLISLLSLAAVSARPNIILLALDDVGWADVGYHGSNFPTPNIDALAKAGVELDRMYAMPQCSPTRSPLLTGRYSFRTGMQHFNTIMPGATAGLPFDTATLAEVLSSANYSTHMVGKWHLGYSTWAQTPTRRGFDSYLGYLQGQTDYYNRTLKSCSDTICLYKHNAHLEGLPEAQGHQGQAYDFWDNERAAIEQFGEYTSVSYMDRVDEIIKGHAGSAQPMFLYYAEQQLHVPIQVPQDPKHLDACAHVTGGTAGNSTSGYSVNRTILCAMASQLDASVGRMVDTLKEHAMWDDTLIWVLSDNGGMTHWGDVFPASASSNWPLRGGKATLFEGGVRSVSFLTGGFLPASAQGRKYSSLMHVSDVMTTLAPLAGAELPSEIAFDGFNLWDDIIGKKGALRRSEVPLNIDTNPFSLISLPHIVPHEGDGVANFSSLIVWPWKLVYGVTCNPGIPHADKVMDGWWTVENYTRILPPNKHTTSQALLFNLEEDESEHHDMAAAHPDIVRNMTDRLQNYWASKDQGFVRAQLNLPTPLANPRYHNWTWSPFRPSIRHSQYGPKASLYTNEPAEV